MPTNLRYCKWTALARPFSPAQLGLLPSFFIKDDPRPAVDQLNERYAHGGGFCPLDGFVIEEGRIVYPASEEWETDEVYYPIARTFVNGEPVTLFEMSWLTLKDKTGKTVVCRVD